MALTETKVIDQITVTEYGTILYREATRILKDGEQIYVFAATTSSGSVAKRVVRKNGPVMINRATVKEFEALDGIGPVLANRIVAYRKINGPFTAIEDVMKVSGIGAGTFAKFKEKLRV